MVDIGAGKMVTVTDSRWSPDFTPPESDDPLDTLWEYLDQTIGPHEGQYAERSDGEVVVHHDWLLNRCWYVHDLARALDGIARTEFTVRREGEWTDDVLPVTARFERVDAFAANPAPVSFDAILETCRDAYPFDPDSVTPERLEFKCGDITSLFCEALWQEHAIRTNSVKGGIHDPEAGEGWWHGFLVVHPNWTTDTDEPIIIDGTAKQFCDEFADHWPATLAPADEIDAVHVVPSDHPHRSRYSLDRSEFDQPV